MNKKQLSEKVAKALSMKRATVEQVLDKSLDLISEALIRDEKVRLVGFGNFLVRTRATRIGRNPQTGDRIQIPSSKSPAFVPGINLKQSIRPKSA